MGIYGNVSVHSIRLSTKIVAHWSILVFLSNGVATEPAMKIQYNLSLFISRIWAIFAYPNMQSNLVEKAKIRLF